MPFLLLLVVALAVGSLVALLAARYSRSRRVSRRDRAARQLGRKMAEHSSLRRLLRGRLEPGLDLVTWLGATSVVVGLAVAIGVVEYIRRPSHWIARSSSSSSPARSISLKG